MRKTIVSILLFAMVSIASFIPPATFLNQAMAANISTTPPTVSITASIQIIKSGAQTTLYWSSTGVEAATIDNGIGDVEPCPIDQLMTI